MLLNFCLLEAFSQAKHFGKLLTFLNFWLKLCVKWPNSFSEGVELRNNWFIIQSILNSQSFNFAQITHHLQLMFPIRSKRLKLRLWRRIFLFWLRRLIIACICMSGKVRMLDWQSVIYIIFYTHAPFKILYILSINIKGNLDRNAVTGFCHSAKSVFYWIFNRNAKNSFNCCWMIIRIWDSLPFKFMIYEQIKETITSALERVLFIWVDEFKDCRDNFFDQCQSFDLIADFFHKPLSTTFIILGIFSVYVQATRFLTIKIPFQWVEIFFKYHRRVFEHFPSLCNSLTSEKVDISWNGTGDVKGEEVSILVLVAIKSILDC